MLLYWLRADGSSLSEWLIKSWNIALMAELCNWFIWNIMAVVRRAPWSARESSAQEHAHSPAPENSKPRSGCFSVWELSWANHSSHPNSQNSSPKPLLRERSEVILEVYVRSSPPLEWPWGCQPDMPILGGPRLPQV